MRRGTVAGLLAVALVTLTAACDEPGTIEGVWAPDDGSGTKTIRADGTCTGMYYAAGRPLDIGGTMRCTAGVPAADGTMTLVVEQPPNRATYTVTFDGPDTMVLDVGSRMVTLERQ